MPSGLPQGTFSYPGVDGPVECTATIAHGRSPSTITLSMLPQQRIPAIYGDLTLLFGDQRVILRDCLLDRASLMYNSNGMVIECTLLDHRWRWVDSGVVGGWFNARLLKGSYAIRQGTEKTPRQLAELCLKQLAEPKYDIDELPNDSYPTLDWDCEQPAGALDDLANRLGCHLVWEPIRNRVKLCKVGSGKSLPTQNVMEPGVSWDFPNMPSTIAIATGHALIQGDFQLEAVGLEPDGSIVPIDNLSYKPTEGWARAAFDSWANVPGSTAEFKRRNKELAKRTVFRWYRVLLPFPVGFLQKPLGLAAPPTITLREHLALESEQVDQIARSDLQIKQQIGKALAAQVLLERKPAEVYGKWCRGTISPYNVQAAVNRPAGDFQRLQPDSYFRTFSIDTDKQIVQFDELVYRNLLGDLNPAGNIGGPIPISCAPAVLKLRTACRLRLPGTGEWVRYKITKKTGAKSGLTKWLKHDEIIPRFSATNQGAQAAGALTMVNKTEVDKEAEWYIDAEVRKYQTNQAGTIKYLGLVPIELDGAIQQVTWHVGNGPTWTQASRNTEPLDTVPSYRERWLLAKSADAAKAAQPGVKPPAK